MSLLGSGALSVEDLLASGGVDTFQLYSFSEKDDSIPTDNQLYGLIGAMQDPKLGTVTASLYTQLRSSGSISLDASDVITVDSVVLSLQFDGFYGKNTEATFEVYRLADSLDIASTYYKTDSKALEPTNLMLPGSETFKPDPLNDVVLADDTLPAQLRLRLNNALGTTLLADARAGLPAFTDNAIFTSTYFKGLHVKVTDQTPSMGQGAIYFFDMTASNSKLTVYYHLNADTETFGYELLSNGACADFNAITVDNTGYDVENVLADPTGNSMETYYAQAHKTFGGIRVPTLKNFTNKTIVHNALLSLPVAYQAGSFWYPSPVISIGYKVDGKITGFANAIYDEGSASYIADLREYSQAVVLGDAESTDLYIYPFFMGGAPERIVFNGPNTTNKNKPKLVVKYTEY